MRFGSPADGGPLGDASWRNHTRDNPYVIRAWRVDAYETVIEGEHRLLYEPDGRTYTLDLNFPDDYRRFRKSGETEGHLRLACTRDAMSDARDRGNWSVALSAIDGGIFAVPHDYYLNSAPASGYRPTIRAGYRRDADGYRHVELNRRFYFMAKRGRAYGSLYVAFEPFARMDGCSISIHYKLNPNASRNLAVAPLHKQTGVVEEYVTSYGAETQPMKNCMLAVGYDCLRRMGCEHQLVSSAKIPSVVPTVVVRRLTRSGRQVDR